MSHILLVEDNELNRDMLSRRLDRQGYEVVMAVDAEAALVRIEEELPSLILMDITLPGMDGYAATRILRGNPATAELPIIALTARAMSEEAGLALAAGCSAFMSKPVDFRALCTLIEALILRPEQEQMAA